MAWLSIQIIVEILIAAALGGVAGWGLHMFYGNQVARKAAAAPETAAAEATARQRVAELEGKLDKAIAENDDLRRKSGIVRPGDRPDAAHEGSLAWRNRHLEQRVRFLEGKLADLESDAGPTAPKEDHNDEATRLRWRNRYLDGRVKYLEEELIRTGGLHPATPGAPVAAATPAGPPARQGEGDRPELFDAPRDGKADDLKLVSGIGPKLEQKLNSIGIWHYAQIASWNQKEIDWVNGAISFRGRVEREKWVQQAVARLEAADEPASAET